jgi:transposase
MATNKKHQARSVMLSEADMERLSDQAVKEGQTQSEVIRKANRWYLDNQENATNDAREAEVAKAIKYATDQLVRAVTNGVDRICKMLARQGIAVGILYEITWMSLPDETAKKAFEQAMAQAKKRMKKHVEIDEQALAEAMAKNVGGQ